MARDEPWHDRLWRFLRSPFGRGLAAIGVLFGPVDVSVLGDWRGRAPEGDGTVFADHPERVRADVPLSSLERELARQLRPDPSLRGRRTQEDPGRGGV
ncbi:DUF6059 family protein [Streptomyces sp. NPDC004658]|uniref:DUF6059 family protein n=1 Tax=Streptomyces sp. NPDC004658 TaxID=3154672 RepID=UPI0033A53660